VHDAELRAGVLSQLDADTYEGLPTAPLFAALKELDATGAEISFDALDARAGEDEELHKLVALVWWSEPQRAEGEAPDAVLTEAESCLATLQLMRVERRLKELSAEIAAAERAGEEARRDALVMEHLAWTRRRNTLLPRQ
jgi:hypothetical protein